MPLTTEQETMFRNAIQLFMPNTTVYFDDLDGGVLVTTGIQFIAETELPDDLLDDPELETILAVVAGKTLKGLSAKMKSVILDHAEAVEAKMKDVRGEE